MTVDDPKAVAGPGTIEYYCGAKTRKKTPCQQRAGHGTSHPGVGRCSKHGGASPKAEVAGVVQLARREAVAMGVPLDIPATHGILECIRIAAGEVRYASEMIADLTEGEVVGPVVSTKERPLSYGKEGESATETVTETTHGPPDVNIWVRVRHEAMDRLVQYESVALKAGIEERQVKLAEGQSQRLANAVRGILADLGVLNDPRAPQIVRQHLELAAGSL